MKTLTKKDLVLPKRLEKSHKGQNGKVLVIGGSKDLVGAVALASIAAARSGVDLVLVATPEKVGWAVNALYPDLIVKKLPGDRLGTRHYRELKKLIESVDVTLIGNGLGLHRNTQRLVKKLCTLPGRKVIDADALKAIDASSLIGCILTPHAKELERFLENNHQHVPHTLALLPAKMPLFFNHGNILLVKGNPDIILSSTQIVQNKTGNPGMTKGGTGDVLAGLTAGFYAQLKDPWQAACNAAYICGTLGDVLYTTKKYTFLASDLVGEIKKILHQT